ncbi:MAG: hypothetical protein JWM53_4321, partial [bacterium]|nr:hypothetical protein [bacterium]
LSHRRCRAMWEPATRDGRIRQDAAERYDKTLIDLFDATLKA